MQLIDGRVLADKIRKEIKTEIKQLGIVPGLAVILVGHNPASHLYVLLKEKAAKEVGIHFEKYEFPSTTNHTPTSPSHPPNPPSGRGGKQLAGEEKS